MIDQKVFFIIIVIASVVSEVTCLKCHKGANVGEVEAPTEQTDCSGNMTCGVTIATTAGNKTTRTYLCMKTEKCETEKETRCCQKDLCNDQAFMSSANLKCYAGMSVNKIEAPAETTIDCPSSLDSQCGVSVKKLAENNTTRTYLCMGKNNCETEEETRCCDGDLCNDQPFMSSANLKCYSGGSVNKIEVPAGETYCPVHSNYKCATQSDVIGDETTRAYLCMLAGMCESETKAFGIKSKTTCCDGDLCNDKTMMVAKHSDASRISQNVLITLFTVVVFYR